ncbi:hypothetical protein Pyn_26282 [Prunus yedoensis var. nudiflora]|uniref:Uncharacterized protein n=1 Tax=Prunus yedoensis var. nudiflora TaxID=2094558 RepID=A0A314ZK60_PRUYE|nr:hypothetical protein Pyn_26282 [Prunus yedoensis var. nudiflora]
MAVRMRYEDKIKLSDVDLERENECGFCLEPHTKWFCQTVAMPSALIATAIGTQDRNLARSAGEV